MEFNVQGQYGEERGRRGWGGEQGRIRIEEDMCHGNILCLLHSFDMCQCLVMLHRFLACRLT